jgi:predicted nucleic acid-binding protein
VKILLDTDVLLDVPLAGSQRHFPDSLTLLNWCENHAGTAQMAWHSLSNIYYLLSRQKPPGRFDARNFLRDLLNFVAIVPTGTAQAQVALGLPVPDFEDALQVSAALHAEVDYIITRNQSHYRSSPVRSLTPREFLSSIST